MKINITQHTSRLRRHLSAGALALGLTATAFAQGTAFTYQGRLTDGVNPATGIYDLSFTLYDSAGGAGTVGSPVPKLGVGVTNGLFTVALDFGAGPFNGSARWLEIAARTNGALAYVTLAPRQPLMPSPYAILAANFAGTLTAGQLAGTYPNALTLNNAGNNLSGNFYGNGAAVANVNAAKLGGLAAGDFWQLGGNAGTTAGTQFLGTTDNQPLELRVNNQRGLRLEPTGTDDTVNVIGGSARNSVGARVVGATIGGGVLNTIQISANYATTGGGYQNTIQAGAYLATIGGGYQNTIQTSAYYATIGGGYQNTIQTSAYYAAIGGGYQNTIQTHSADATISGGNLNTIYPTADFATIGGGNENTIQTNASAATIGGGENNAIGTNSPGAVIAGGLDNSIWDRADGAAIGGGASNRVFWTYGVVGGGWNNQVINRYGVVGGGANNVANPDYAVIAGGLANYMGGSATNSFIGGGQQNYVGFQSPFGTIAGGSNNTIQDDASRATVAGGSQNTIGSHSSGSVIGGGEDNTLQTYALRSVIGGGGRITIEDNASESVIGGGWYNRIRYSASFSVLGGGSNNRIETNSSYTVLAGGLMNVAGTNSSYGVLGGGYGNALGANAWYATVPGGDQNLAAGTNSFAAGHRAKANHTGAFVWADSTDVDLASLAANSMTLRAAGGVRFFSNSGATLGVSLAANGTSWGVISDRNAKKNFQPVDGRAVLEQLAQVPVQRWNYKAEADDSVPHLGPMAQDFKAAFYPGRDDTSISTLEFDGVALAAIQGLNQKLEAKNAALEQEMAELKTLVKALAEKVNGGGQ